MIELTDREKMISNISWLVALSQEHRTGKEKLDEILEAFRKNKFRKMTQDEVKELYNQVVATMQESADFLELYGNGDIPK